MSQILDRVLTAARQLGASDVHLKAGLPPIFRIKGDLRTVRDVPALTREAIAQFAVHMMNDRQRADFEQNLDIDLAYGTMPMRTTATAMYSTVHNASDARMPNGRSRCGFFASCAAVETASKPMYAKNMTAAPRSTPLQPKLPKLPVFGGMKGVRLSRRT